MCAVPFVAPAGVMYYLLLSGSDINYALTTRPPGTAPALIVLRLQGLITTTARKITERVSRYLA